MANCPVTSRETSSVACSPAGAGDANAAALEAVRDFIEPRLAAALAFADETPPRLAEAIRRLETAFRPR